MSTLGDLCNAIRGQLLSDSDLPRGAEIELGQVVTDSRQVTSGAVFWALRGPRYDGADFLAQAVRRGASAIVVNRGSHLPEGHLAVEVDDTAAALGQWARWKRQRFPGTVIGVTGSVGKTTTRHMIHTVLKPRLEGIASPRNYNNHVGLPLSMFGMESHHDYAVLELGASRKGEIAALAELCSPKVGVITQVGDAHLGGFGSRRGIAEAKAELLAALPPDGRAVLGDDPWLRSMASKCPAEITWVGRDRHCDVRATDLRSSQGTLSFRAVTRGMADRPRDAMFHIPVWGRHHLTSALAAIAVGRMMGFDLEEMAESLEGFRSLPMRSQVREVRGATIINDAYNASPTAMRAALELIRDFEATGKRIVVCGDMAELGAESLALHWQLGRQAVTLGGAHLVIACGQFARQVVAGARTAGLSAARAISCRNASDALPFLGQALAPGDVVLIKGSRTMAMERIAMALESYPRRRSA